MTMIAGLGGRIHHGDTLTVRTLSADPGRQAVPPLGAVPQPGDPGFCHEPAGAGRDRRLTQPYIHGILHAREVPDDHTCASSLTLQDQAAWRVDGTKCLAFEPGAS